MKLHFRLLSADYIRYQDFKAAHGTNIGNLYPAYPYKRIDFVVENAKFNKSVETEQIKSADTSTIEREVNNKRN